MSGADLGGVVIEIEPAVLDRIREEVLRASPQECCGVLIGPAQNSTQLQAGDNLAGRDPAPFADPNVLYISGILPAANIAPDPVRLFEIDPETLIAAYRAERAGTFTIIGFYHSHPRGEPVPSVTDQAMAARDGKVWLIAGEQAVACWRDDQEGFSALSYFLTGR